MFTYSKGHAPLFSITLPVHSGQRTICITAHSNEGLKEAKKVHSTLTKLSSEISQNKPKVILK